MEPQPKYKTRNFPNLGNISKELLSCLADFNCSGRGGLGESVKE